MNYTKQYIADLIEKFNEAQTTESEEQILADYFTSESAVPDDWKVYQDMFNSFSSDAYDFSEAEISEYTTTHLPQKKAKSIWHWASAACVAGIAGLLWLYMPIDKQPAISVSELCETMAILSNAGYDQISSLSAAPNGNGYIIKAALVDGQSCSFSMQRTDKGFSIKLL